MNTDTLVITLGIASFTLMLTILIIYSSFGPGSDNLLDPFEEDND